jgi:hypothetical protein
VPRSIPATSPTAAAAAAFWAECRPRTDDSARQCRRRRA